VRNLIVCSAAVFVLAISVIVAISVLPPVPTRWAPESHYPLYDEISAIQADLLVNITDSNFPAGAVRECQFIELREEDSGDYFQTTVDYLVFQTGQGVHGDIDALVEIYNEPDSRGEFVVEVSRLCWHELTVSYKGRVEVVFPAVKGDGVLSLGYFTCRVAP
jgi:hypothetical protein